MNATLATVLVACEDDATRTFLADNLTADGYDVATAKDAGSAVAQLRLHFPDVLIADLNGSTLGLVDSVRAAHAADGLNPAVPVLALTGRADELNMVRSLEHGCDDVIAKPFSYPELRARLGAVLRRLERRPSKAPMISVGSLSIDVGARMAWVGERRLELSRRPFDLLVTLAHEPTRVFTKEQLLRAVWGIYDVGTSRTLDSHAARLRVALNGAGGGPFIRNVWGVGYRLVDGEQPGAVAA